MKTLIFSLLAFPAYFIWIQVRYSYLFTDLNFGVFLSLIVALIFYTLLVILVKSLRINAIQSLPLKRSAYFGVQLAIVFVLLQDLCSILLTLQLRSAAPTIKNLYDSTFENELLTYQPRKSLAFQEHHYLNYALNPKFRYGTEKEFSSEYKIRRREPIRPRNQVRYRILVLGGSTTFGEQIKLEADTWVYRLEEKLRLKFGNGVDVVNGGVGGYTLKENFVHYVTALTHLDPDLVIIFAGINDVHPRLFDDIEIDYGNYRKPWRSDNNILSIPVYSLRAFTWYRLYYLRKHIIPLVVTGIGGLAAKPYPSYEKQSYNLKRNSSDVFYRTLSDLTLLIEAQGRTALLIPQQFKPKSESDRLFRKGVVQHNRVLRNHAKERNIKHFSALSVNSFDDLDFFDNCHLNPHGSLKMSSMVYDYLLNHRLPPLE